MRRLTQGLQAYVTLHSIFNWNCLVYLIHCNVVRFILFIPFFYLTAPSYSSSVFSYRWFLALVISTCFQVNTVTAVKEKKNEKRKTINDQQR